MITTENDFYCDALIDKIQEHLSKDVMLQKDMHYASTIQQALMPRERHFKRIFSDYYVLYKPQNIIGGDFYWIGEKDDWKYACVADCTGHGVAGAMLSVLGIGYLNYLILGKENLDLGQILKALDEKWIEAFHNVNESVYDNDWMELSIVAINTKQKKMRFASANNNCIVVIDDEVQILKGNNYPIGGWQIEKNRDYHEKTINLPRGSKIYLGSDGLKDQFGGVKNKKLSFKRIFSFVESNHFLSFDKQQEKLNTLLLEWKGENLQTDDITLLALSV